MVNAELRLIQKAKQIYLSRPVADLSFHSLNRKASFFSSESVPQQDDPSVKGAEIPLLAQAQLNLITAAQEVYNHYPVFQPVASQTVEEGALLSFQASAKDEDGDPLFYSAADLPSGASFDPQRREFKWRPGYFDSGVYRIKLYVSDGRASAEQGVDLTVADLAIPQGAENFAIEGISFVPPSKGGYLGAKAEEALVGLARTGVNYVGLVASGYLDASQDKICLNPEKAASDEEIARAIEKSKHLGRKVFLRLELKTDNISLVDPGKWFKEYTGFAGHYARLCQRQGVDIFCFGSGLDNMFKPEYAVYWDRLVSSVRSAYSGKITFSASSAAYRRIPFWDKCDYLGTDGSFALVNPGEDPGLGALVERWNSPSFGKIIQEIENWQGIYQKPVLFTDAGFVSSSITAPPAKNSAVPVENQVLQKRCLDSLFLVFQGKPWFAGVIVKEWPADMSCGLEGLSRRDYTLQNKQAQSALVNFYSGPDPRRVARILITDSEGREVPDAVRFGMGNDVNLYARAYADKGEPLGFAPCEWKLARGYGDLKANQVGFAKVRFTLPGLAGIAVKDGQGNYDGLYVVSVQRYLKVPQDYPTITAAMEEARGGDIIQLWPGTYQESVVVKDRVKLIGIAGGGLTKIEGALSLPEGYSTNDFVQGVSVWSPVVNNNVLDAGNPVRNQDPSLSHD